MRGFNHKYIPSVIYDHQVLDSPVSEKKNKIPPKLCKICLSLYVLNIV